MLGEKYSVTLAIGKEIKNLQLTFQNIKNIYSLTNQNPFNYLNEFIKADDKKDYVAELIYCLANGKIDIKDINVVIEDANFQNTMINLMALISKELDSEIENNEEIHENTEKIEVSFEEWWNEHYFTATVILKMSEEEFLNSTPREVKTLNYYKKNYIKGVLMDTYASILKAKGNSEHEEEEQVVTSFRGIFS